MITLNFPNEFKLYDKDDDKYIYNGEGVIAPFELLWSVVDNGPMQAVEKNELKALRNLKNKLKEISIYKDDDADSRIMKEGDQKIELEDLEYDLACKLLKYSQFKSTKISDNLLDLWTILEDAK